MWCPVSCVRTEGDHVCWLLSAYWQAGALSEPQSIEILEERGGREVFETISDVVQAPFSALRIVFHSTGCCESGDST